MGKKDHDRCPFLFPSAVYGHPSSPPSSTSLPSSPPPSYSYTTDSSSHYSRRSSPSITSPFVYPSTTRPLSPAHFSSTSDAGNLDRQFTGDIILDGSNTINFLQQINHQQQQHGASTGVNTYLLPPPPPPPPDGSGGSGGGGSLRPSSMVARPRMAKISMPEMALRCPRCESTDTKFCYFNNYNLAQPRHFCKTCKRYWTRGGALRNLVET